LEAAHGIAAGALRFELQIETPPAVLGAAPPVWCVVKPRSGRLAP
jgi:hypothetical protein